MLLASSAHVLSGCFVPYLKLFFVAFGAPVNARAVASMVLGAGLHSPLGLLVYRVCGSAPKYKTTRTAQTLNHIYTPYLALLFRCLELTTKIMRWQML